MAKVFRFWKRPHGVISVMFDGNGKWHSTGCTEMIDAEAWARQHCPVSVTKSMTVGAFTLDLFIPGRCKWIVRRQQKGSLPRSPQIARHRLQLEAYILPRWAGTQIRLITRREVDDWLIALKGKKSRKPLMADAKNKILSTMRVIMTEAVDVGIIDRDPCEGITQFRDNDHQAKKIFTIDELQTLFPTGIEDLLDIWLTLPWAVYFFIQASCGLRPGEVSAFNWSNWHRNVHGLVSSHAIENTTGKRKETKTGVIRPLPLTKRAEGLLLILESISEKKGPDDLIFPGTEGRPIMLETQLKHFKASVTRAKLTAGRTPYCLRHSFDTHAMQVLDAHSVKELMGHNSLRHTMGTYYHPEDADRIKALPPGVWENLEKLWQ